MNCNDCGQELTKENSTEFGGKDEYNYRMAVKLSPSIAETFIKCDDCFVADIDQYLESQAY